MKFIRNVGEGQSQCIICAARDKYNVNWSTSTFSLCGDKYLGYRGHAICGTCARVLATAFDEELEVLNDEH